MKPDSGGHVKRRTSDEVRALILESAHQQFISDGYQRTTTKQIARAAGVIEPLLFRHFGSKAGVFEAAVVSPFIELIETYAVSWEPGAADDEDPEGRIQIFLEGLLDLARENRALLLTALTHRDDGVGPEEDVLDRIATALQRIAGVSTLARDYPSIDPQSAVAVVGSMIFGLALLEPMLFARGKRRPSRTRVLTEMQELMMRGIAR